MYQSNLCPVYHARWLASDCSPGLLNQNHSYSVGKDDVPTFVRLDDFWAARPTSNVEADTVCECGRPSSWHCYAQVYSRVLLGGERVCRTGRGYTVYPADERINAAILGIANKYISPRFENGLPCEEFRDLCNQLVLKLHTYVDGTVTTYFLVKEASAYLKSQNATQSLTTSRLRKTNKGQPDE